MAWEDVYEFDGTSGVWRRTQQAQTFAYTDGDETEELILRIIRATNDKSAGSDDLVSHIVDWPTEYHFSPSRHNLLAGFGFRGAEVLEIGAGCGALTRFLGESEAQVVAVEGSPRRAAITAARCDGLRNVIVINDNFKDFPTSNKFDCIVAVGVLEYAPSLFGRPGAVDAFLKKALSLLKPSGCLILAIENQLGLKYFSGCTEDHTGRYFFGIEDRYREEVGVVTFGRLELADKLRNAGFCVARFFYPFPDYKLPKIILSEEGTQDRLFGAERIVGEYASRDYGRTACRLFAEEVAWDVIGRNGLLQDFANSFLVIASPQPGSPWTDSVDWLARSFTSNRLKRFRTITTFTRTGSGIKIVKERFHPELDDGADSRVKLRVPSEAFFVPGETLRRILVRKLLNPETTLDEVVDTLQPWARFLKEGVTRNPNGTDRPVLPGTYIDCVPWNLIQGETGISSVTYFDSEWELLSPLHATLPLVRGLFHLDLQSVEAPWISYMSKKRLILHVTCRLGIPVSESELPGLLESCADFAAMVTPGEGADLWRQYQESVERPYVLERTLSKIALEHDFVEAVLLKLREHLFLAPNSRFWRMMEPIRKIYNFLKGESSSGRA